VEPMLQVVTLYVAIVYGLLYGRKSSFDIWLFLC
jgi:hypothetical protein